ncbi:hypothetical protein FQZ97_878530 [compost metagenome]
MSAVAPARLQAPAQVACQVVEGPGADQAEQSVPAGRRDQFPRFCSLLAFQVQADQAGAVLGHGLLRGAFEQVCLLAGHGQRGGKAGHVDQQVDMPVLARFGLRLQ